MFNIADFLFFWCFTFWWYWKSVHCLPGLPLGWAWNACTGWEPACLSRWGTDKVTKRRWQKRGSWNDLGLLRTIGIQSQPQCGVPRLWALGGAWLGWQEGAWARMAPSPHTLCLAHLTFIFGLGSLVTACWIKKCFSVSCEKACGCPAACGCTPHI